MLFFRWNGCTALFVPCSAWILAGYWLPLLLLASEASCAQSALIANSCCKVLPSSKSYCSFHDDSSLRPKLHTGYFIRHFHRLKSISFYCHRRYLTHAFYSSLFALHFITNLSHSGSCLGFPPLLQRWECNLWESWNRKKNNLTLGGCCLMLWQ